jgi:hypothetical protein
VLYETARATDRRREQEEATAMGAWESGPFENDDAMDWTFALTDDADLGVVAAAFSNLASEDAPEAPECSAAMAAAEVVAAGLGRPNPELPDEVAAWVARRADRDWATLVPAALAALVRISDDSELAELWAEEEGDDDWSATLDELRARLAG